MIKTMIPFERLNALEEKIKRYEASLTPGAPEDQKALWSDVKGGIEEIIRERKAPHLMRIIQLPLILIATPEIVSLPQHMGNLANIITTGDGGGLADISAALVKELDRQGVNVHVALPEYKHLFEDFAHISHQNYEMLKSEMDDENRIHLIEDGIFESATRVYNDVHDHLDKIDLRRANAFQRGILHRLFPLLKRAHRHILVHCNDWMTGIIPAAAKSSNIRSLMTFHNIFTQFQWIKGVQKHGIHVEPFWKNLFYRHHPDTFGGTFEGNYEHNDVDFMTSGLYAADFINTVSPTFLKEIVEGYFQEHYMIPDSMRAMVRHRYKEGSAIGILNAPELTADPRIDPLLARKFWYEDTGDPNIADVREGKQRNKAYFQHAAGLKEDASIPLFFWPSRIAKPQKGFELLLDLIPHLMGHFNLQIAVVANGDLSLIPGIEHWQRTFPGRVCYRPFNRQLSQIGKAAADFLLMPSLYEPCGIPQVEAPRYGTLPIVRRTGGLADTVDQLSNNGIMGNGFVFQDFIPSGLWFGIQRAMSFYKKKEEFKLNVLKRIMKESFARFNIQATAKKYIEVYEQIFRRTEPGLKIV
jgi:ADP-glucose type glycogen/starch synthase